MQHHHQRAARIATAAAFATNGALPASLFARYAEALDSLSVGAATFGLVAAGFALGAAGALHIPGVLIRRLGSARTTTLGTGWMTLTLVVAAAGISVGSPWLFMGALVLAGLGDAVVDVAQNSQALRVQSEQGKSLLASMHAGWSVGAVIGGAVGTVAADRGIPLVIHLASWGALCTIAVLCSTRFFVPDVTAEKAPAAVADASGSPAMFVLLPVVLVALAGIAVEDVGNNWAAILLALDRGVAPAAAGIGLTVVLTAQFVGRLVGDRFIDWAGQRSALVGSLVASGLGLSVAAWAPTAWLTLCGLAIAGLGSAIVVPIAFARADAVPGLRPHAGLTWISWAMRVSTIGLTPLIGVLSALGSLSLAISAVALLALLALLVQLRTPR